MGTLSREQQFLGDYQQLRAWCGQHDLKLTNHVSLNAVANRMGVTNWRNIVDEIGGLKDTGAIIDLPPSSVIVVLGSQFGLGIPLNKLGRPDGIVFLATVNMSLLSGHYVGIRLYRVENATMKDYGIKFIDGTIKHE